MIVTSVIKIPLSFNSDDHRSEDIGFSTACTVGVISQLPCEVCSSDGRILALRIFSILFCKCYSDFAIRSTIAASLSKFDEKSSSFCSSE